MAKWIGTIVVILFATAVGFAQVSADSSTASPANPQTINMGWLLLKTIGFLVLIIALIVVSVYLLKKYVFTGTSRVKDSDWLQVLAQTQIQPKKSLALVKVLDRVVLIGMSDASIQTLAEFENLSSIQSYLEKFEANPGSWNEGTFLGLMKKNLKS